MKVNNTRKIFLVLMFQQLLANITTCVIQSLDHDDLAEHKPRSAHGRAVNKMRNIVVM